MLRKSFKYRIYPTTAQADTLEEHLRICCELYNAAIQERRDAWRTSRIQISRFDQNKQLTLLKGDRPDVAQVYARALEDPLRRVDLAFRAFFARLKRGEKAGYPRYRSRSRYDSLVYSNHGFSAGTRTITVSRFGDIKAKIHRQLEGTPKRLTLKREGKKWFASFLVELEAEPLPTSTAAIGIDVGLARFATLSDGRTIDNPRHFRAAQQALRLAQRRMGRRKAGSARRRKAAARVRAIHVRTRNQRADFHHKLARELVNKYGLIAVEHLNVKGLARGILAKSVNDAGWTSFIDKLTYKAESAGRELVKVNPRGTSQTCICGAHVSKRLSEREHVCPACGLIADRDHVSAQVILQRSARCEPSGVNVAALSACVA